MANGFEVRAGTMGTSWLPDLFDRLRRYPDGIENLRPRGRARRRGKSGRDGVCIFRRSLPRMQPFLVRKT